MRAAFLTLHILSGTAALVLGPLALFAASRRRSNLLVVSAGDISTTAEIIAWILPAAIGVPLIFRTHMGARADRPMPRVL